MKNIFSLVSNTLSDTIENCVTNRVTVILSGLNQDESITIKGIKDFEAGVLDRLFLPLSPEESGWMVL